MSGGKHGRGGKHGGSGKGHVWTIVLIVAAIVLAVSLGVLGVIGYGYWHGTKVYDDISATSGLAKEETALADMTVNWDALREQNEDIVGWVYMPGTSIDYPIVQGENDEEYLQKDSRVARAAWCTRALFSFPPIMRAISPIRTASSMATT